VQVGNAISQVLEVVGDQIVKLLGSHEFCMYEVCG